jgi:hypothetical protein
VGRRGRREKSPRFGRGKDEELLIRRNVSVDVYFKLRMDEESPLF